MQYELSVIIEPDGDGFHAYSPSLPGLHTCGETEEETLENVRNAALAYLESMIKHGDPLPIGYPWALDRRPNRRWGGKETRGRATSVVLAIP
ncbi:MAG: type II toxin-antitoxin system HicB family antitoxin [Chloroflexi bacterium]|nr:type II toxin-antitoxin system HicB family antitoxin [Chloroflexota bacterium]